jgi:hypothetical protein
VHSFFDHQMFNPHNASPNDRAYNDTIDHTWLEGVKAMPNHDARVIADHARVKAAGHSKDMTAT